MKKTIILSLITLALVPALTTSSAQAMEWNNVKTKVKSAMPGVASRIISARPWIIAGSIGYFFGFVNGAIKGLGKGRAVGKHDALNEAQRKICGVEHKECNSLLSSWADINRSVQKGTPAEEQAWASLKACEEPYTKSWRAVYNLNKDA